MLQPPPGGQLCPPAPPGRHSRAPAQLRASVSPPWRCPDRSLLGTRTRAEALPWGGDPKMGHSGAVRPLAPPSPKPLLHLRSQDPSPSPAEPRGETCRAHARCQGQSRDRSIPTWRGGVHPQNLHPPGERSEPSPPKPPSLSSGAEVKGALQTTLALPSAIRQAHRSAPQRLCPAPTLLAAFGGGSGGPARG